MHRSGTSLLVRSLSMAGVHLPPNLLPPAADNPDGFQESADFVALNDALLASQGCAWDSTWDPANSVSSTHTISQLGLELRRFLLQSKVSNEKNSRAVRLLALKDPRLCRTLQLWAQQLDASWFDHGVAIVRHPFSVVSSIGYRDDMHPMKAIALWLRYNLDMLRLATEGSVSSQWPVITFDSLIRNPSRVLDPLIRDWQSRGVSLFDANTITPQIRELPKVPVHLSDVDQDLQDLALSLYASLQQAQTLGDVDHQIQQQVAATLDRSPKLSQQILSLESQRRTQLGEALALERRGSAWSDSLLGEADLMNAVDEVADLFPHEATVYMRLNNVSVDLRSRQSRRSLKSLFLRSRRTQKVPLALANLTMTIHHGERIALLGHNGSGKTTLLRLLSGIYSPTDGQLFCDAELMEPIIEQSLGFNNELTGLQLARFAFYLLHPAQSNWSEFIHDIEDFTELGSALADPIKTWSQGMRTRLSFALATTRRVCGLALDEGLAAGDQWFQRKAKQRLDHFMESTGTVVFASHSTDLLRRYCTRALILEAGKVRFDGSLYRALQLYKSML